MDRYQERLLNAIKDIGDTLVLIAQRLDDSVRILAESRVTIEQPLKMTLYSDDKPLITIEPHREEENDQNT